MVAEKKERNTPTAAKAGGGERRLPHERDEAPDQAAQAPRGVGRQAASDLAQGLVDTDLHGQRGVEAAAGSGKPGQARPQADAGKGMRHHDRK